MGLCFDNRLRGNHSGGTTNRGTSGSHNGGFLVESENPNAQENTQGQGGAQHDHVNDESVESHLSDLVEGNAKAKQDDGKA